MLQLWWLLSDFLFIFLIFLIKLLLDLSRQPSSDDISEELSKNKEISNVNSIENDTYKRNDISQYTKPQNTRDHIQDSYYCPSCGEKLSSVGEEKLLYCPYCGNSLTN